jgi:hypothetical protein
MRVIFYQRVQQHAVQQTKVLPPHGSKHDQQCMLLASQMGDAHGGAGAAAAYARALLHSPLSVSSWFLTPSKQVGICRQAGQAHISQAAAENQGLL